MSLPDESGVISLRNVSLHYHDSPVTILRDISWKIARNEKWVLFGPNGSGKTKLLEIITGYIFPGEGTVSRFGADFGTDIREVRKRIGYVSTPLRERFHPRAAVAGVVAGGADATIDPYGEPGPGDHARAAELLASIGMADKAKRLLGTLSDGEKQKAMMLRAIMASPDLLVLDEPAMGLDLAAREDLLATLATLCAARDMAVIYVTHYTEEISPVFGNIFMLKKGSCWFRGAIEEGITDERLSGIFDRTVRVLRSNGRYYAIAG